ncbi:hypothetical protein AB0M92_19085 [Streptomyces sp. NPDC051582]|uniref:hypothetical protein n=1 Tax=Streptomyces sp. NPDC051582 TaxID=3155167 RepID=UPI00341BC312
MSTTRTVDYFLQVQQPDGSWETGSGPMHDYNHALARLGIRRQTMPEYEHRIAQRTTVQTVTMLPIDEEAPTHIGGNAEDCPACARYVHNVTYPSICPGPSA